MTALLVACAVCDDTAGGGVPLDVVSSTRRRGGSEGSTANTETNSPTPGGQPTHGGHERGSARSTTANG